MRLAGVIARAALALALAGAGLAAPAAQAQDIAIALAPGEVLLKVEAEGVHRVRPDMMEIEAGAVTTGRSAKDALAANAALANRLIAAVRGAGIKGEDVQTSELRVSPRFSGDRDEESSRITGYVARNQVKLRLRDLAQAPDVINALFSAGANQVRGPTFTLSDRAPALRAARAAAVAEARLEADTYAEALGMRVARVLQVSERRTSTNDFSNEIVVTGTRITGAPVEPGELSVNAQVWIDYALVPR